jgi:uncharacterized protein with PIN domain
MTEAVTAALPERLARERARRAGEVNAFSYVLARTREAPLLFSGDDFGTTDVAVALLSGGT